MSEFLICAACVNTEVDLVHIDTGQLRELFNAICGIETQLIEGPPTYLCLTCLAYVKKFNKFREQCLKSFEALQELIYASQQLNSQQVVVIDRATICPLPNFANAEPNTIYYDEVIHDPNSFTVQNKTPTEAEMKFTSFHYEIESNTMQTVSNNYKQDKATVNQFAEIMVKGETNNAPFAIQKYTNEFENTNYQNGKLYKPNEIKGEDTYEIITSDITYEEQTYSEESYSTTNNENTVVDNMNNTITIEVQDINTINNKQPEHSLADEPSHNVLKLVKTIEFYAQLEPMSIEEARAAHDVYLAIKRKNVEKLGSFFTCDICESIVNGSNVEAHLEKHEQTSMYYCDICQLNFSTEKLVNTHKTLNHMFKFVCRMCSDVNYRIQDAEQHYHSQHKQVGVEFSFEEKKGNMGMTSVATDMYDEVSFVTVPLKPEDAYNVFFEKQDDKSYKENRWRCELCFKGFSDMYGFNNHMKKHDPERGNYECDYCKIRFKNKSMMTRHIMDLHHYKYLCKICDFVTYHNGMAIKHDRKHRNIKYPCSYCNEIFLSPSGRAVHVKQRHPTTEVCNICGHSFTSEHGLHIHRVLAHTSEERELSNHMTANVDASSHYYCIDCNVQFVSSDAYTTHLNSGKHTDVNLTYVSQNENKNEVYTEIVYKDDSPRQKQRKGRKKSCTCTVCGLFLESRGTARRHYKEFHKDVEFMAKVYQCDQCPYSTKSAPNIYTHKKFTHTQDKPFKCPLCGMCFRSKGNLQRHNLTHTGERPYECAYCQKRFKQKSTTQLHIQTVHLRIPYPPWQNKNKKKKERLNRQRNAQQIKKVNVCQPQIMKFETINEQEIILQQDDVQFEDEDIPEEQIVQYESVDEDQIQYESVDQQEDMVEYESVQEEIVEQDVKPDFSGQGEQITLYFTEQDEAAQYLNNTIVGRPEEIIYSTSSTDF